MIDYLHEEAIGKPGSFSQYDMKAIYPAIHALGPEQVYLEVGVQYGRSLDFVRRNSEALVYGVDIDDSNYQPVEGATFIHKPSNQAVMDWKLNIDVLFIDGDHSYEGCADDFNNFSPFVNLGGTVFFHDCDETSPGVVRVFEEIDPTKWEKVVYKTPEMRTSICSAKRLK